MKVGILIAVVLFSGLMRAVEAEEESAESWLERMQMKKRVCLQMGEQNLMALNVPEQVITLEQAGQQQQLLGYKMSDLVAFTPQGKQLMKRVTATFQQYETDDFKKACQDYDAAAEVVLKQSECSLLEILESQAVGNAKILGENNGVHKFNLYRKACFLLSIV